MMISKVRNLLNTCLILLATFVATSPAANAQVQQVISLDQAVKMGMDYSHQLESSQGRYDYTKAKHDQAYDLGYPLASLSSSYARLSDVPEWIDPNSGEALFPVYQNSFQNQVSLNQLVFAGFRVRSAKE